MGYRAEPGAGGGGGAGCWACAHAGTCWAGPETHRSRKSELGTGGWGPALTAQPGPYGDLSRLQQGHGAPGHPGRAQGAQVRLGPLSPWVPAQGPGPARLTGGTQKPPQGKPRGRGRCPAAGRRGTRQAGRQQEASAPSGRARADTASGAPAEARLASGAGAAGRPPCRPLRACWLRTFPDGTARLPAGGTPERTPARPPWLRRASGSW